MRTLVLVMLTLIVLGSLAVTTGTSNAATSGPVTITGPANVAINSSFNYSVTVQQVFSNYSATMFLSGYNLTGASPISPTYVNSTGSPSVFNITAPRVSTTLFLFFQIKALSSSRIYYYNLSRTVHVKQFTLLSAVIKNPTDFKIAAINVSFTVNGKYIGSKIVDIAPNSTQNVTYEWVSGKLSTGIYTVTVAINNNLVKIQNGSYTFKLQSGNPFVSYIYIGIIAFFAIIIVVTIISNYYKRKKRPKWKK